MIFATSLPRFKAFLRRFLLQEQRPGVLPAVPYALPPAGRPPLRGRRLALGPHRLRDAGWLLRWLGSSSAPAALLAAAQAQLRAAADEDADRLHLLILDSTMHGQQGNHTQNTTACGNTAKRP